MSTTPDTSAPTRLTRRDRARIRRWLWRFTLAMQDHPSRETRRITRDLRAALLDDAGRVGVDAALAEMGSPLRLAADYLDGLGSAGPRWNDGAVAAVLLGFGLPLYLWAAWSIGALDAVGATGGGSAELTWMWVPMTVVHTDEAVGLEFPVSWQPFVVSLTLGALGFALWSRLWRLRRDVPVA